MANYYMAYISYIRLVKLGHVCHLRSCNRYRCVFNHECHLEQILLVKK